MQRQTKLCVSVGREHLEAGRIESVAAGGADALVIPWRCGDDAWIPELVSQVRAVERNLVRPLAIIVDVVDSADGPAAMRNLIGGSELEDIDFLAISCEHGSSDVLHFRDATRGSSRQTGLIEKLDSPQDFENVEGIAKSADGVMITRKGLHSLAPSAAPIAQKTVSRQCQVAAKPCLVERNATRVIANGGDPDLAAIFDLANVAFDHVDCVVLREVPVGQEEVTNFLSAAAEILVAAESYLEITDRPVRVGFGQPPHTAALAYAIRHILKMQEIAAVAVYSLTGQTSRVIAKNWIACPILAFSSRPETARKTCLYHGVTSRHVKAQLDPARLLETAGMLAKDLQIAVPGDRIIVVSGHPDQTQDQANGFIVETIS